MTSILTVEESKARNRAELRAFMIERLARAALPGSYDVGTCRERALDAVDVATAAADLLLERFPVLYGSDRE